MALVKLDKVFDRMVKDPDFLGAVVTDPRAALAAVGWQLPPSDMSMLVDSVRPPESSTDPNPVALLRTLQKFRFPVSTRGWRCGALGKKKAGRSK